MSEAFQKAWAFIKNFPLPFDYEHGEEDMWDDDDHVPIWVDMYDYDYYNAGPQATGKDWAWDSYVTEKPSDEHMWEEVDPDTGHRRRWAMEAHMPKEMFDRHQAHHALDWNDPQQKTQILAESDAIQREIWDFMRMAYEQDKLRRAGYGE